MNIIIWLVFGALTGWIASMIMKTDQAQGPIANIVVGIIGAFIGGFIMQSIGGSGVTGFNVRSLLVAILGSVVLIGALKLLRK